MQITICRADCAGNARNCRYPTKVVVADAGMMKDAAAYDHVCGEYKGNYRTNGNFLSSDVVVMDLDNDHTDDPAEWVTEGKLDGMMPDISYILVPSRHHMLEKDGESARPRYHVYFPVGAVADAGQYTALKRAIHNAYTGSLLLQKEFIADPITKHRKKNRGELPQYYVEGTHPAIIDKDTFDYVQAEMERRRELGALANKSLDTCCFTGKIKCPHCGVSYMHNRRTDRGLMEFWNCGSKKKKKVGAGCPVGGTINHQNLMKACADVLGTEGFDEDVFLDRVDHIEVPEKYTLEFFFKDGNRITRGCPNTGHQDCWTAEYRAATSEKRRKYGTNPRGATCFTGRIKCAECGNNYRQQTRKRKNGEKYHMFSCATTNTCGNNSIHGDDLQRLSAEAVGLDAFDASAFSERIDHVVISKGGRIAFHFKDGGIHEASYSTKRKVQPWTEERRKKQAKAVWDSFTGERRQKMSESMKRLRKERGDGWRRE